MLITLYDTITPSAIPAGAQAVAGYVGGNWPSWSPLVARFPNARHKSIAVNASEDADILDIESGDATPDEYPGWHRRQVARGHPFPGPYANASTMPAVRAAVAADGISPDACAWWVASWDDVAELPAGAKAKQYIDHGPRLENYDLSVCDPTFWPSTPVPPAVNRFHYDWFAAGPFPSRWGNLSEQQTVERYDGARKHPAVYAAYLKFKLRPELQFLADRVAFEAIHNPVNGKPSWGTFRRGWRYQNLAHRAQGQRFA